MSAVTANIKSLGIWTLSQCWSAVNYVARWGVKINPGYVTDLGVRTISVGNVQAGGSGKTPLVRALAQEFIDRGLRVCILSRGYCGMWERDPHALTPREKNLHDVVAVSDCGDEVALLRELLPKAWFGVGADRVAAFFRAQKELELLGSLHGLTGLKFDCVILDDGLQHWKIRRDLDLIAVTSDQAHERVFRESLRRILLKRSGTSRENPETLWVWTKGERSPFGHFSKSEYLEKSVCKVRYHLEMSEPLEKGAKVWSVSGIADPQRFYTALVNEGLQVIHHLAFGDHHHYRHAQLDEIFTAAKNAGARVVTTGKDSVKWRDLGFTDFNTVEPVLEWESGRENWDNALWR